MLYTTKILSKIVIVFCVVFWVTAGWCSSPSQELEQELTRRYGLLLENPPFEVRKEYHDQTDKSWRYLTYREKLDFLKNWLDEHPGFLDKSDQEEDKDPALEDLPSKLQSQYGIYLENAPYAARLDFFNAYEKSWNDIDYPRKKDYLTRWLEENTTGPDMENTDISPEVKNILGEIHKKYGKDLYNAPFEARVEYFQTYNQSWRDINYETRKLFLVDWYQRNEEMLKKFKAELQKELALKLKGDLENAKLVELEIPESFGENLKDVPFELKRQYFLETGNSWNDTSFDMKELYAKKWLIEHEDVLEKERKRSEIIYQQEIEIDRQLEKRKEERERYREEIERRKKEREERAEQEREAEQKRRERFRDRFEDMRERLQEMRERANRDRRR
jgi:hypothetical protein